MSARRRGFVERVALRLILLRPFRCEDCDGRHYELFFRRLEMPRARQVHAGSFFSSVNGD